MLCPVTIRMCCGAIRRQSRVLKGWVVRLDAEPKALGRVSLRAAFIDGKHRLGTRKSKQVALDLPTPRRA